MKSLLFLLAIFTFSCANAQSYHPLITQGKQSSVSLDCGPCPSILEAYEAQLYFDGDSVLNGTTYHKLMMFTRHYYYGDETRLAELLREDAAAHKIYRFAGSYIDSLFNNPNYMTEELLWNYDLQIGDSIEIGYESNPKSWYKVAAIDTITLQNNHKARVYKTNLFGNSAILFTEEIIMSRFTYWHYGMAYHYPDMNAINCAQGLNGASLYPANCASPIYISVQEEFLNNLEIYPNPASSVVVLNSPSSGDFELYDVLGKLVLKSSISADEQTTLSVANLPAGMYVWVFRTEKGLVKGKLLIEK